MKKFQISFVFYTILLDIVSILISFNSMYLLRQTTFAQSFLGLITETSNFMPWMDFNLFVTKSIGLYIFVMFLLGGYSFYIKDRFKFHFHYILKASLLWSGITFLYFLLMRSVPFSRSIVIFSFFVSAFLISFFRKKLLQLKINIASKIENQTKVLIIASDKNSLENYIQNISKDSRYFLAGIVAPFDFKNQSKFLNFKDFVNSSLPIDIIIDLDSKEHYMKSEILAFARFNQVEYSFVPGIDEFKKFNFEYDFEHNYSELTLIPSRLRAWNLVLKRIFDILISFSLLIVLSPVLLLVAVMIKLESKGPIFFIKDDSGKPVYRIGQNKIPFVMYKFRTMKNNSHLLRYTDLADKDFRKGSPMVKIQNDPRVTKLGKILRRFDIDELPQLINVLIGDMSLVGPRPHLNEEVLKYQDHHNFVFTIKPGITGLPQVSGRSDLDFEKEITLDSLYIEKWSFWLDLKILLKTPFVVFLGHGEQASVAKK